MSDLKRCHEHRERSVFAWCDHCNRPCCDDCAVEILGDWVCERCKLRLAEDVAVARTHGEALRAGVIGALGVVVGGLLLGPYALFRAHAASGLLDRAPWLRGRWLVRAGWLLGALGTLQGLVWLLGMTVFRSQGGG
jgi:hypothetical protein